MIKFILFAFWIGLSGCAEHSVHKSSPVTLRVWSHQGQEAENIAMREMAEAFNRAHKDQGYQVSVDFFPDYQYTEKLSIAAAGEDLPDVFDLDGPTVAQFADAGLLRNLAELLPDLPLDDFQPAIIHQGTFKGRLYALGAYDSALVLYGDKKKLDAAGITLPSGNQAWTWEEFREAMDLLKAFGTLPVAMHMQSSGDEWFTYAFSPIIWSGGGALISTDGKQVEGILNSPQNIKTLQKWQKIFENGWSRKSPVNPDPFGSGETALDWNGHWVAQNHLRVKKEDLVAMPLPRFGPEPAAASGSWCWAVSAQSEHPEISAAWMKWVLDSETGIAPMVKANGSIPSRKSAYTLFPQLEKAPLSMFRHLQENHARARPRTPIYPNLTRAFASALRDIARGADVEESLNKAARNLQRILERKKELKK